MTKERFVEVDMTGCNNYFKELRKKNIQFCKDNCPVEPKNAFLGCSCRPIKYQKECPRLREYYNKGGRK